MEELTLASFPFSMKLDETIDASQWSNLLSFIHCMLAVPIKSPLSCEQLLEMIKTISLFEMVKDILANQILIRKRKFAIL